MGYGQYSQAYAPSKPIIERKSTKRLKHVFDNPAHVWAHPREKDGSGFEQTEAWNGHKNFYFKTLADDTRVLYSYRDSYPIGARFVHKKKPVYLVRSGKPYSITTSGHMSCGSSAVPHNAIRFDVPDVAGWNGKPDADTHVKNLADIAYRIGEAISEYTKAHALYSITCAQGRATSLTRQAKQYAKFFNVKLPKLPTIPKLTDERREKARAFDSAREARSAKIRANRDAKWAEQRRLDALSHEEKVTAWRAGSTARFWNLNQDGFALLRVKGSNVETSQGVSVAINGPTGAARLLRFLTACKESGRTHQRNGRSEHIGQFVVDSFGPYQQNTPDINTSPESEWVLLAGCHRIKWSEVLSISDAVNAAYKPE